MAKTRTPEQIATVKRLCDRFGIAHNLPEPEPLPAHLQPWPFDKPLTTRTPRQLTLPEAIDYRIKQFGSQARLAKQVGVGKAYINRLKSGNKEHPSDEVLTNLGIERHIQVYYTLKRKRF